MIDPWKFNPLTNLGKKAREYSEIHYIKEVISIMPNIINETKKIKKEVRDGKRKLINNSNNLFL